MGAIDDGFEALLEPFYNGKKLTDPISTKEDKYQLLPAFLKVKGLVKQHIDSYNFFVEHEIKDIVRANRSIRSDQEKDFWLEFTDIRVGTPTRNDYSDFKARDEVTPMECRLRDMTYAAPVVVDIVYSRERKKIVRKDIPLCRIPVMLKSAKCCLSGANNAQMEIMNECPLDPGGYFIINGTEKVILIQEQLSKNRVIVEADEKTGGVSASVTSSTHERKSKTYVILKKDRIVLNHNVLVEPIPIVIVLKALGGLSDYEIMELVAGGDARYQDDFLTNFDEATKAGVYTQQQALEYVGTRVKMGGPKKGRSIAAPRRSPVEEGLDALANIIIAHVTIEDLDFYPKAIYIAMMVRRVLMAAHNPKLVDDRDFVGNKRLELAGQLLSLLFEDMFKMFVGSLKSNMEYFFKKPNRTSAYDPVGPISSQGQYITQGLNRAIQSGNWHVKRFNMNRAGVTHVLSRLSYIAALGMMTRISSQFEKTRKVSGPRALQPSQWGMLCPSDTPEGEACGLVKNLALMTHITTNAEEEPVKNSIFSLIPGVAPIRMSTGTEMHKPGNYIIHLNGTPFALTSHPKQFAARFKTMRRRGHISPFIGIHINEHFSAIHIATDEGRICRPYIIVKDGKSRLKAEHLKLLQLGEATFDDFLRRGVIEYLDVNEENDALIAIREEDINQSTTHMEIEPFTILGAVAGLIPFPHHNQSPRNTYQCAMGKQAIGAIAYNQFNRIDTLLYTLVYPQRPMVITKTIQLIHYDKLPAGQNATVVVMSYSGYDIEDALVLNKASCDRGFGRCQVFRKYTAELQQYPNGRKDRLGGIQKGEDGRTIPKHACLDKDGLAVVGYRVHSGETMIMKETPIDQTSTGIGSDRGSDDFRPAAINYRIPDPAYIDKVMVSNTEKNTAIVKVQTRQTRRPELGDKFSSRHGQKGVVGIIVDQEDMPFSDSGLVPDIIMNPHGFPSRMTVGKLFECLTGKASVVAGRRDYGFGDAFRSHPVEEMGKVLIDHGFSWEGKDYFTSGITGEPHEAYLFNGPIYYQRLKHMVQDKMHSRSRGPRAILTRQPTEGRSRDGGLRLGEMERDCLIAYGASQLLLERLMYSSDATQVDICERCGLLGYKGFCQTCGSTSQVTQMTMPYAAKLLVQELISMNVGVRMQLEDKFPHPR
ncbi:beta and beta-prime subunits of DNA dependent RNA-polymerase [Parathielavia appendiculata]|uniref:DNA-directed RNA polymerase subunit beta n=1 Tax=Parathielavia appendiculata TaxID=2587402 RepID=A0AAN6Z2B6_9PEZI|nr:beta and beta-prime subunits of DNA dependent RNA-polymerase [Parathielavia appendiculata]